MGGTGLGQLWNDYLDRIITAASGRTTSAPSATTSTGAGPPGEPKDGDDPIVGYDGWWIKQPIPRPGSRARPRPSRGGRSS